MKKWQEREKTKGNVWGREGREENEQLLISTLRSFFFLKKKFKIIWILWSYKWLVPSGFAGLLQIGLAIYGTGSKDSTCADFEQHAGRDSVEQGAGSHGILREAFVFLPGSMSWLLLRSLIGTQELMLGKIAAMGTVSQISPCSYWHIQSPQSERIMPSCRRTSKGS